MPVETIAALAVAALAPHLPALLAKAGEGAAAETGKRALGAAWDDIVALWARLRPAVDESATATAGARRLARNPSDARARGAFELELEDLLKADAGLRDDVGALVNSLRETAASQGNTVLVFGAGGVAIGGNMTGGSITTHGDGTPARSPGQMG